MPRPFLTLLLLLLPATGLAQDEDRALDNFRRYLARSPYHDRVFDQLVRRLRGAGELDGFVSELEAAPRDEATRILLARLRAERGEVEAALALLSDLAPDDPRGLRLRAHFRARAGDRAGARGDLVAAAERARDDPDLLRALLEELSAAQLAAGDRGAARATLERLADLAPDDPAARLDAGQRLARAGLQRAAADQFERAAALAGDDAARRCDALAALGRQREVLGQEEAAIEAYLDALPRLRRGHWLAQDLRGRLLRLFERGGRSAELVARQRAAVDAAPGDAGARELLALALERDGRAHEASTVLADAVARFPDDHALSALRREVARRTGDLAAELAELQRLHARSPRDVELAFTLAEALAAGGQREAAAARWDELLAEHGRDASLARRVAERWVAHGEVERAHSLYERARALAPDEVDRHLDLARFLVRHGMAARATPVLRAAEQRLAEAPRALVALGEAWDQVLRREDATRCWRRALVLAPEDAPLRFRLGVLLTQQGQLEEAREHLRGVASRSLEWELARLAAQRFVQTLEDSGVRDAALRRERERLARQPTDRGAHLIVIALQLQARSPARVERAWRALVEARPQDGEARLALARWLGEQERFAEGIQEYHAALERLPRRAREILLAKAALHAEAQQLVAACNCLERVIDLEAQDPEALADVARRFEDLGRPARALATWQRVLRLRPDDPAAHLAAARVARGMDEVGLACEHLRAAWRDPGQRAQAAAELVALLGPQELQQELAALDARVRADPFDLEAVLLGADLLAGCGRREEALARVEASLGLRPHARDLLERKARLCLDLGRSRAALEAFAVLRAGGGRAAQVVTRDMLAAHLQAGLVGRAVQLATELDDPLGALDLFAGAALQEARIELLQAVVARPAPPPEAFEKLARLCEDLERWDAALAALERLREVSVTGWQTTRRIGALRHALGDRAGARAEGARLLSEADDPQVARAFFVDIGARDAFYELTTEHLLATLADEPRVRETFELLHREGQRRVAMQLARRLRVAVIERRTFPEGYSLEAWARWLHGVELGGYSLSPQGVRAARLTELREREAGGGLSEKHAVDLLWLAYMQQDDLRELRDLVGRLVARYPRSPLVLGAAGWLAQRGGDPSSGASLLRRAAAALGEPKHAREVRAGRERAWAKHAAELRPRLGAHAALTEPDVGRALALAYDPWAHDPWWWPVFPDPFEVELAWGLCEARAGQPGPARQRFAGLLEELGPDDLARRARVAAALAEARITPSDQQALVDLAGRVAAVRSHPELRGTVAAVRASLRLHEVLAAWVGERRESEAYVLVRLAGHGPEAREFLYRRRFYGRAQSHTRLLLEQAQTALASSRPGLERQRALRRLHDATVVHAEALRAGGSQGDHDQRQVREEQVWQELARLDPRDLALLWRRAGRADWAGDWATSAAAHRAGAHARQELAGGPAELRAVWEGQLLTELVPPRDQAGRAPGWQELRFQSLKGGVFDPTPHLLGAVHACLMLGDTENAALIVEQLLASGPPGLDPGTVESVLGAEEFGEHAPRARAALERWRAEASGPR